MRHFRRQLHVVIICLIAHEFISLRANADELPSDKAPIELRIEKLDQSDDLADFLAALKEIRKLIAADQQCSPNALVESLPRIKECASAYGKCPSVASERPSG